MKPASFDYFRAQTLAEAVEMLARLGSECRVIAGGQSLVPLMNLRFATPSALVDLNAIDELRQAAPCENPEGRPTCTRVGAMVRHTHLAAWPVVRTRCPMLAAAASEVGHLQIRNRGTLGGSLAHADPHAEYPLVMSALDASIVCRSTRGERAIAARDFTTGAFSTMCAQDEIITHIEVPGLKSGAGWGFFELTPRTGDFPLVAVAAIIEKNGDGSIAPSSVWIGGCADRPVRLEEAESVLSAGRSTDPALAIRSAKAASPLRIRDAPDMAPRVQSLIIRHAAQCAINQALETMNAHDHHQEGKP